MNKTILIGRLTKDIEVKVNGNNNKFATFTLAVNRQKRKDQEKADADFINCILNGEKAIETLTKYVEKGHQLAVEGSIRTGSSGEGANKKYFTNVQVERFEFLGGNKSNGSGNNNSNGNFNQDEDMTPVDDGDMPF